MTRNKLYGFGEIFISKLGKFVEENRKLANANGISDEEFRKVAKTTFEILGRKTQISISSLSQNLRKR